MKIRNCILAMAILAVPLTGAFAQGGTAPDISVKESKQWAKDNNTPVKKAHRKAAKPKTMASPGAPSASPTAK